MHCPFIADPLSGWIYVETVSDFTGWLEGSAAGVHHHQSPFVWMFKMLWSSLQLGVCWTQECQGSRYKNSQRIFQAELEDNTSI
jgi:hypothetical protein